LERRGEHWCACVGLGCQGRRKACSAERDLIVDAAKVPLNVVVLPDAVWFAVLVFRLEMGVALVVDAADAEFETVSMAEMRVSKF
jgi:hypothetical protein